MPRLPISGYIPAPQNLCFTPLIPKIPHMYSSSCFCFTSPPFSAFSLRWEQWTWARCTTSLWKTGRATSYWWLWRSSQTLLGEKVNPSQTCFFPPLRAHSIKGQFNLRPLFEGQSPTHRAAAHIHVWKTSSVKETFSESTRLNFQSVCQTLSITQIRTPLARGRY